MRCEDCPTRICLDDNYCPYDMMKRGHPYQKPIPVEPPTEKQYNLVQIYLRHNRFINPPSVYSKQAYHEFIRDVVIKDETFRYNPSYVPYEPDEDHILEFCQNDAWCEEY